MPAHVSEVTYGPLEGAVTPEEGGMVRSMFGSNLFAMLFWGTFALAAFCLS